MFREDRKMLWEWIAVLLASVAGSDMPVNLRGSLDDGDLSIPAHGI